MINVNLDYVQNERKVNYADFKDVVAKIHKMIHEKTGPGNDFLGWVDYPVDYNKEEIARLIKKAKEFRDNYDCLVVCGIGGSYLGARAAIEAINGLYSDDKMEIVFYGNTLDPDYCAQTLKHVLKKNFAICCISKSGTTTETAVGFRFMKNAIEEKYGKEEAKKRIVCVTDKARGALKTLATNEGYDTYILPDDIGGRFSVVTPVGLFPIACAGISIEDFLLGFKEARTEYSNDNVLENEAYKYACARYYLYTLGYKAEMLISYQLKNKMLIEWWKQLFDESEGKDGKALLCASAIFTTDLHSMGQFIQDGSKVLFETIINVENPNDDLTVKEDKDDLDGLNYLTGKDLNYINNKAFKGTLDAHSNVGNVPNLIINIDKIDAKNLGHFFYFFMKACAMSAYLLEVNPFNQPGVEVYKKNMFHLLGKKGY